MTRYCVIQRGSLRMARRKGKKSTPRRKFKGVYALNAAEAAAQLWLWTEATMNTNPIEFITGRVGGKYNPSADGGSVITLPELAGFTKSGWTGDIGGRYGNYADNFVDAIGKMSAVLKV